MDDSDKAYEAALYIYEIPEGLRRANSGKVFETLGLKELTPLDEVAATQRAGGNSVRLAFELTLQSLVQVNGKVVRLSDGTADIAWRDMGPKLRNLMLTAYGTQFGNNQDDVAVFLASRKLKV